MPGSPVPTAMPMSSPHAVVSWPTRMSSFAPAATSRCASFTSQPAGAERSPPLIFGMTQNVQGASQPSEILR